MVFLSRASSDRKVCRMCPANFCWCLAESSDLAWHFVQQGSLHIKCLTTKTRMTTDICQSLTGKNVRQRAKMSDRAPSEHFVWNTRNNFCDYCSSEVEDINMIGTGFWQKTIPQKVGFVNTGSEIFRGSADFDGFSAIPEISVNLGRQLRDCIGAGISETTWPTRMVHLSRFT